jgi:hypothetical protein
LKAFSSKSGKLHFKHCCNVEIALFR